MVLADDHNIELEWVLEMDLGDGGSEASGVAAQDGEDEWEDLAVDLAASTTHVVKSRRVTFSYAAVLKAG
jgi:hypothetical protein